MIANPFDYDDATHTYRHRKTGAVWPSVTQVIDAAGLRDVRWYDAESVALGLAVHEWAQYIDDDAIMSELTDARILPYVSALRRFVADTGYRTLAREVVVWHDAYTYAGRADWIVTPGVREMMIDIKTGEPARWHAVQTAAYFEAARACGLLRSPLSCATLYLRDDGDYQLRVNGDPQASFHVFAAARLLVEWRCKNGD